MDTIYVYTKAYNAEKTLRRTVDSILNQSYSNFVYYLCDNGSIDGTRKIVEEYAGQDSRIVPFFNRKNNVWDGNEDCINLWYNPKIDGYICLLDADDEYKPDFLEKMLAFLTNNNLDIAACGSDFVNAQTNKTAAVRNLSSNLFLEDALSFNKYFPTYHQFMRTNWGKLYRASLLRNCDYDNYKEIFTKTPYGGDTLYCMRAFKNAKRVGILAESLHVYYVSPKSLSYNFSNTRINSDRILDDETRLFLTDKCGTISQPNDNFLNGVYFHAIKDTLNVVLGSQASFPEKITGIHDVFTSIHTKRLIAWQGMSNEKKQLFEAVANWLVTQKKVLSSKHKKDNDILTELEISLFCALNKPDAEMLKFMIDVRKRQPKASERFGIDMKLYEIVAKYPLLTGMPLQSIIYLSDTMFAVMRGDLQAALDKIMQLSGNKIPLECTEGYLIFAQRVCASLEYAKGRIFFKKLWAKFLLDNRRINEASAAVNELVEMLPTDIEVAKLKTRFDSITATKQ